MGVFAQPRQFGLGVSCSGSVRSPTADNRELLTASIAPKNIGRLLLRRTKIGSTSNPLWLKRRRSRKVVLSCGKYSVCGNMYHMVCVNILGLTMCVLSKTELSSK